jgi:ribosomal protein L11 methyltransferase
MFEFRIQTSSDQIDNLHDQLALLGALAISMEDTGDQPIYEPAPGETIFWHDTTIVALFEDEAPLQGIHDYLQSLQADGTVKSFAQKEVLQQDWVRVCLDQFTPMQFGKRLWIVPSWHAAPDESAVNILLDPGLAFGTGTHPTTRLCLEWLDGHIQGGETVIDYGCGSGILAIAALKLGADSVAAVDHEPQALEATRMNATQNLIAEDRISVFTPDEFSATPVDILIANILAQPLIDLAPHFATLVKLGGHIVLSGIFKQQATEVSDAYQAAFDMATPTCCDDWIRLEGVKR